MEIIEGKLILLIYPPDDFNDSTFWWIEGIGSEHGPLGYDHAWYFKPFYLKTICYDESDITLYSELEDWYSCDSIIVSIAPPEIDPLNEVKISPNPFKNQSLLTWNAGKFNSRLHINIYNISMQNVFSTDISNTGSHLLNFSLHSGYYYLVLSDEVSSKFLNFLIY